MAIGFYNSGPVKFPHRPYPRATLRVVEKAIAEAWRIIRDTPGVGFDINAADENRITRELRTCLVNRVLDGPEVPGFASTTFDVSRGAEFESFDGQHLSKKPDLHFAIRRNLPRSLRSADGIFVECKPVDSDHPAGGDYCDKGIIRFVLGEYAWAMPHGYMVGYVTNGYRLPDKLDEALKTRKKALKLSGRVIPCPDTKADGYTQQPHITVHRRSFRYLVTDAKAPPITLRHLWFDRN
jgi:hypothetical protein